MLLEFGARNFYSFKEGFEASLRLNAKCPKDISKGRDFTPVLAVKGNNASGKTNVLKTLAFLRLFCRNSFSELKPEDEIEVSSFFDNEYPIEFYLVFKENDIEYTYELALTNKEVLSEILYQKKKQRVKVFERDGLNLVKVHSKFKQLEVMRLRKNASLISTAHQYEMETLEFLYDFFSNTVTNVTVWGLDDYNEYEFAQISSEYYKQDKAALKFVKNMIKMFDQGVDDVKILERVIDEEIRYLPVFTHVVDGEKKILTFMEESSGTKKLYCDLGRYYVVLDEGGVLIMDEFDINYHSLILPCLIDLFNDPRKNPKNAQLIFTTHNDEIMNTLSKYRTLLVAKEVNESYAFRVDEIPGSLVRNDRPISPLYLSGKLGGVPIIKDEA